MSRWTALVLAVIVVGSAMGFFAFGGAHANPSAAPQVAARPAAGLTILSTDVFGVSTHNYYVGYAQGQVYFQASDLNADPTGTVAINDLNATRDALVNPVHSWTVTFTLGQNRSWLWGGHYLIPPTLKDGGRWNITLTTALGGFTYANFTVHTYAVSVYPTQPAVIAAHPFQVAWAITWTVNDAPYTNFSSLTLLAGFFNGVATVVVPGTPASLPIGSAFGTYNVTAPAAATRSIILTLWANQTIGTQSESGVGAVPVATVDLPLVTLQSCISGLGCFTNTFLNGTPVYVIVRVSMTDTAFPFTTHAAPGLTAKFTFENNGIVVTAPGAPPASLTTNSTGGAAIVFLAFSPPFSTINPNQVVVTITDPLNPTLSQATTVNFFVTAQSPQLPRLQIVLNSAQYYGGDTVIATWTLWGVNASVTKGWSVDSWAAIMPFFGTLVGQGTLTGGAGTGTFSFPLAVSLAGQLEVVVHSHNSSASLSAFQTAIVTAPEILLAPTETSYLPGDSVTVFVTTDGQALASATLYQTISDSSGYVWATGVLAGTQIHVGIPTVGAPAYVYVNVAGQTASGGLIAQASVTLGLAFGFTISAGVATASSYSDGSYQPGQTIQIAYQVTAYGTAVLPKIFTITLTGISLLVGVPGGSTTVQTSNPSGQIPLTIPKGAPAGVALYYISARLSSVGFASSYVGVNINPNPSALNYQLAPNTGLTVGLIILIIAVILVALLLFMLYRRRARPVVMHPVGGSSSPPAWTESTPPSGPTPSGPASPGQPPLPGPSDMPPK